VNYGVVTNPKNESLPDLTMREWWAIGPTAALAVFMGVAPNLFLRPMEPAVTRITERLQARQQRTVQAPAPLPPPVELRLQLADVARPLPGVRQP
jgi:NADH:ubiquinone oxidoreductase subunit 4 (subunit M)